MWYLAVRKPTGYEILYKFPKKEILKKFMMLFDDNITFEDDTGINYAAPGDTSEFDKYVGYPASSEEEAKSFAKNLSY